MVNLVMNWGQQGPFGDGALRGVCLRPPCDSLQERGGRLRHGSSERGGRDGDGLRSFGETLGHESINRTSARLGVPGDIDRDGRLQAHRLEAERTLRAGGRLVRLARSAALMVMESRFSDMRVDVLRGLLGVRTPGLAL